MVGITMWAGTPWVLAARARAWAWFPVVRWSDGSEVCCQCDWSRQTTTMRRNALFTHTLNALLLNQSSQSVESSSGLEGTDLLLVLAFEEQLDFGVGPDVGSIAVYFVRVRCRLAGHIRSGTWTAFGSRRRSNLVYCLAGDCGCPMDVSFDSLVGSLYR